MNRHQVIVDSMALTPRRMLYPLTYTLRRVSDDDSWIGPCSLLLPRDTLDPRSHAQRSPAVCTGTHEPRTFIDVPVDKPSMKLSRHGNIRFCKFLEKRRQKRPCDSATADGSGFFASWGNTRPKSDTGRRDSAMICHHTPLLLRRFSVVCLLSQAMATLRAGRIAL